MRYTKDRNEMKQ